jgi:hypothetical protein
MKCPRCGRVLQPREGEEQISCAHCGHVIALKLDEASGAIVAAHMRPPVGTRVIVDRSQADRITIHIPHSRRVRWIFQAVFYLALVVAIVHVFLHVPDNPMPVDLAWILLGAVGLLLTSLHARFGGTRVSVDTDEFSVIKSLFGIRWRRGGRASRIVSVGLRETSSSDDRPGPLKYSATVAIQAGLHNYKFGFFLSPLEKMWIARELRVFLREIGHPVD